MYVSKQWPLYENGLIMFYEMMQKRNILQKMNFFLFVIGEHMNSHWSEHFIYSYEIWQVRKSYSEYSSWVGFQ